MSSVRKHCGSGTCAARLATGAPAVNVAVGHTDTAIVLSFTRPVDRIELTPDTAAQLAALLQDYRTAILARN